MSFGGDELIPLAKRGEVRPSKLYIFDDVIRALINSIKENEPISVLILVNVLVGMLAGGTTTSAGEKRFKELVKESNELLDKYEREGKINISEILRLFNKVMYHLNKEHNYLFVRKTDIADEEEESDEDLFGGFK